MEYMKDKILNYIMDVYGHSEGEMIGFTTSELAISIKMQRSNLSTILNQLVREEKLNKIDGRPILYFLTSSDNAKDIFTKTLIGSSGSLRNAIQLAKAVLLYPERNLSFLIIGRSGSGRTIFANCIYQYAIDNKILDNAAKFISIDCRYYIDDKNGFETQLLQIKQMLETSAVFSLIDNVEFLSSKSKNILFQIISETKTKQDSIFICVCRNEDNPSALNAIRFEFTATIELPNLTQRGVKERFDLIQSFLSEESRKIKKPIRIGSEVLRCLLLYKCQDDLRQLQNDIKIACANSFIRENEYSSNELKVYLNDFPPYVRKGWIYYRKNRNEIEAAISKDSTYSFYNDKFAKKGESPASIKEISIYDTIQRKTDNLRKKGILEQEINQIISEDIEVDLQSILNKIEDLKLTEQSLNKLVDIKLIEMVDDFLNKSTQKFSKVYPISTFCGLCLHLSTCLKRKSFTQCLSNEKIIKIGRKYQQEYEWCLNFAGELEQEYKIKLSIDEVIFMTLFICEPYHAEGNHPSVLIAMHGNSTASSLCNVVNSLTRDNNTFSYDLPLDKDMDMAYAEIKQVISNISIESEIILIYDMGSIRSMAEMISRELKLKIHYVETPTTLLALDCARMAAVETNASQILEHVADNYREYKQNIISYRHTNHKDIVITLCMTGKGGAEKLKKYIEENVQKADFDVIPFAVSNHNMLIREINNLMINHNILSIVGTYNPNIYDIPFVSIRQLFDSSKEKLPLLLSFEINSDKEDFDYEALYEYLSEQIPQVSSSKIKRYIPKVIRKISKTIQILSEDQKVGLLMHITCCIARLYSSEPKIENLKKNAIILRNKRMYNDLKDCLNEIEEEFQVAFDDDEIANIMMIVQNGR